MREEYDHHYNGDVITLVSYWSDPKFEWMYNYQATCKALYLQMGKDSTIQGHQGQLMVFNKS